MVFKLGVVREKSQNSMPNLPDEFGPSIFAPRGVTQLHDIVDLWGILSASHILKYPEVLKGRK